MLTTIEKHVIKVDLYAINNIVIQKELTALTTWYVLPLHTLLRTNRSIVVRAVRVF